jgi:hypothetical protein
LYRYSQGRCTVRKRKMKRLTSPGYAQTTSND